MNIETILEFNLKNGGFFIANVSCNKYPDVLELFASFFNFQRKDILGFQSKLYDGIPLIIIDIANGSRVDNAFRLLKRCARHALDSKAFSLLGSTFRLFKEDGEIGIMYHNKVSASMKSDTYDVEVSFSKQGLIVAKCSCRAGSIGSERVTCVHICPVLFQLTLILCDGLAEHILLEFTAIWSDSYEQILGTKMITLKKYFLAHEGYRDT